MIRNIFRRKPKPPIVTGDVASAHALLNRSLQRETPIEQWEVTPYRDALLFRSGRNDRYLVLGAGVTRLHSMDDIERSYGALADAEALSADWDAVSSDFQGAMETVVSDANHTAEEKLVRLADEFFDAPARLLVFVFDSGESFAIGAAIATDDGTKTQAEDFDPEGVGAFYESAFLIVQERKDKLAAEGRTPPTEVTIVIDGASSVVTRCHGHSDMVDEEPINERFESIVREWEIKPSRPE